MKLKINYCGRLTNKVRLCEQREPQSEPFVGQARQMARNMRLENIFFEVGY